MRRPSEYVPAALARLRGSLIPDCAEVMRHGDSSAQVVRVGSRSRSEDTMTETDVSEFFRVLAFSSDFPRLAKGEAVELERAGQSPELHIVTAIRSDITGDALTVGLSAAFTESDMGYDGRRSTIGGVRRVRFSARALTLEMPGDIIVAESSTGTTADRRMVCIASAQWPDETPPQTGDKIALASGSYAVKSVRPAVGYWILEARQC